MHLSEIATPALLLDLDRLEANIARMAGRARSLGVDLRPHIKTHKCLEVGRMQREHGARGITVATLYEANAFAQAGFEDITWAFPLILNRIDEVIEVSRRTHLNVVVDSPEALELLERHRADLRVFLKVDCGYHRAGVSPSSPAALELCRRIAGSSSMSLAGLLTHAGHSYDCHDSADILAVARQERDVMVELSQRLRSEGLEIDVVSIGSTPTMSVIDELSGVDEIRPGNYVFYDRSQVAYASCSVRDCALSVLASVVSCQPGGSHSVIDAGALALSKDGGAVGLGQQGFGGIYEDYEAAVLADEPRLTSLSQEHGIVLGTLELGRKVRILPNHSCLTAAQFDEYLVTRGDEVVDRWPILRRR